MIIKNHKHIYTKTAERFDLDRDRVEMVGHFTWAELNKLVADFKEREIYVLELGCFRFRKREGDRYMRNSGKDHVVELIKAQSRPENLETNLSNYYDKRAKVQRLLDEWEEIIRNKIEFKTKLNESINGDIQEQKVDLGGTKE